jgi:excisionase family DNA binding protein
LHRALRPPDAARATKKEKAYQRLLPNATAISAAVLKGCRERYLPMPPYEPAVPAVPTPSHPPRRNVNKTQSTDSTLQFQAKKTRRKPLAADFDPAGYLRRKGAAQLISVSPQTLDKWHRAGELEYYKRGRLVFISRRELLALIESGRER